MVNPSGLTNARYSPAALSEKLVCNGWPGSPLLPEANTSRKPPGGRFVDGKRHLTRFAALSVRYHPFRSTAFVPGLNSSTQSDQSPSSSRKVPVFDAMNSVMSTDWG